MNDSSPLHAAPLTVIDLFSGIGGFSYAAENIVGGFRTTQFVEINKYCQKVLRKHWPRVPIHDDITNFMPQKGSADVVCGGFPCQDISFAGRQAGIKQGTRSGLFYELMRVVRSVRPSYVVLENVAAICSRGLGVVLGEMAAAGYDCEWACIRASELGACHRRDRWWLVAYPNSAGLQRLRPECQLREIGEKITPSWSAGKQLLSPAWGGYISKPLLHRGDDGLSHRVDRIKALGNSVVPQVASIPLQRVRDLNEKRF